MTSCLVARSKTFVARISEMLLPTPAPLSLALLTQQTEIISVSPGMPVRPVSPENASGNHRASADSGAPDATSLRAERPISSTKNAAIRQPAGGFVAGACGARRGVCAASFSVTIAFYTNRALACHMANFNTAFRRTRGAGR